MELVSKWIMSIVGAAVLCLLADLIMPEGSTKKHIKSVMSIITLFIILSPLSALLNKDWRWDNFFDDSLITPDNRIIDNVYSQQIALLEESLERKLSDDGYKNLGVSITGYIKDQAIRVRAVSVNASQCDSANTQSDYEKIKQKIKSYLNDNDVVVIVYG
ncbi:MAG TPA: stage III sporulation protein AF [Clostridia bacterium]